MATVLADIMFRDCNSSLLRQHAGNQCFFLINVYTGTALGRCVTLLWVEDGKPWSRQLSINGIVNLLWSFVFSCTQEMQEIIIFPCLRVSKNGDRNSKKFHEKESCVIDNFVFPLYHVNKGVFTSTFIRHYSAFTSDLCSF
jgi:hypothetical protein